MFSSALDVSNERTRSAFLTGFVCAMSRLILLHVAPDRYEALMETSEVPLPTAEAEERTFGTSYRALAPTAAESWDLPERLCAVLQQVAEPTEEAEGLKHILALAIQIGSFLGGRDLDDVPLIPEGGLEQIQTSALGGLVTETAQDASTHAAEVGHF